MRTQSLRITLPVLIVCVTLLAYAYGYEAPAPIGDCVCGDIVGQIVETSSGTPRPISGATATLDGSSITSGTNSSGHFHFDRMPAGDHKVRAEAPGFTPVESTVLIRSGETTDMGEITLARAQQAEVGPFLLNYSILTVITGVAALAVGYAAGTRRRPKTLVFSGIRKVK